jgi:hypothetical protein
MPVRAKRQTELESGWAQGQLIAVAHETLTPNSFPYEVIDLAHFALHRGLVTQPK